MRILVLMLIAICVSVPAFAGVVKQDSIACNDKELLDTLTTLAAAGTPEVLTKTENEYVENKSCVRLSKGTSVEIIDAKRVIAGDPKIRGNQPHRRVSYHLATVKADGTPWVMHLQNIDD